MRVKTVHSSSLNMSKVTQPIEWISIQFIASISAIINIVILTKELKKRNSENITFTTKSLKIFSLLSMICGALFAITNIIDYLPLFCSFTTPLIYSLISNQFVFIGIYQLSRIYYCFSSNQVHSTKGYPNSLFIIMYTIGILLALNGWIYPLLYTSWDPKCGITNNWKYKEKQSFVRDNITISNWTNVSVLIYIIWDIFTLLLYVMKVYTFRQYKTEQIQVYNRFISILRKVTILTVFYQIPAVLCIVIGIFYDIITDNDILIIIRIIYRFSFLFSSVLGNYSMYLMQQHNDEQYKKLLKVICCNKALSMDVPEKEPNKVIIARIRTPTDTNCGTENIPLPDIQQIKVNTSIPSIEMQTIQINKMNRITE